MSEVQVLWQIGSPGGGVSQFALSDEASDQYFDDGLFVVGLSDPMKDWPYAHPGPEDPWAYNKPHTFHILFELGFAGDDDPTLIIDLAHTHHTSPPVLAIRVNGEELTREKVPVGVMDDAFAADPFTAIRLPLRNTKQSPHQMRLRIPAERLYRGDNHIEIETVSGAWVLYDAITFETSSDFALRNTFSKTVVAAIAAAPALVEQNGTPHQPVRATLRHFGLPMDVRMRVGDASLDVEVDDSTRVVEMLIPESAHEATVHASLQSGDNMLASTDLHLRPVKRRTIHLLHHTHLDIGYTHTQDDVERIQHEHMNKALELIDATNDYPEPARFRWLPEQLYHVETYLRDATDAQRDAFVAAVHSGRIGLDGFYGNALTGIHSDEELFALLDYGVRLREQYGFTIESAMISDVPGWTWGLVTAMAQSGIKYLSSGPNPFHRVGWIGVLNDKPCYWKSPCGKHKILLWQAGNDGYAWFHGWRHPDNRQANRLTERRIYGFVQALEDEQYPYEHIQLRYNIDGDNGPPDPNLPDAVKSWNEKHLTPKFQISTTWEMFRAMEAAHGDALPEIEGDITGYWEDGAASTAADTAHNREAVEMLVDGQVAWAMLNPGGYSAARMNDAWRDALLYDEHTWGGWNSISDPDSEFAVSQAERKAQFAYDAWSSAAILQMEPSGSRCCSTAAWSAYEVFNTHAWPVTDLIILPEDDEDFTRAGDRVRDGRGNIVPSQRLSSGELAFIARDVPALGSATFTIEAGEATGNGSAKGSGHTLSTDCMTVEIDPKTGAIRSLTLDGTEVEFCGERGLNEYVYVAGREAENQHGVDDVRVTVVDSGPLVARIEIESAAPGVDSLIRSVSVIDGFDRVDVENIVNKTPIRDPEGVFFAFDCNVKDPVTRIETPFAVIRPEADQLDGACKDYFCVQRWFDVSNSRAGVTVAVMDAPLLQVGEIRTDIMRAMGPPEAWTKDINSSSRVFSYVMNNYWETNYKADQEGPCMFRYSIRPHAGKIDQADAARFGMHMNRRLAGTPSDPDTQALSSLFTLHAAGTVATCVKPSRDGSAILVRLHTVQDTSDAVTIAWPRPTRMWRSGPDEQRGEEIKGEFAMVPNEVLMIRAESVAD